MDYRSKLPENYQRLVDFASYELGLTFSDRADNIKAIARHMDWKVSQVRAILGILTHQGVLRWDRTERMWTVVEGVRAA